MDNITGKIVAITGGSSGLGAESARHLVAAGAKVALGARRMDRLQALQDELGAENCAIFEVDVTDRDRVQAFAAFTVETFGRIDVMVANAGLMPLGPVELLRFDEWDACIDVNVKGMFWSIAAALPYFKAQKSGQFVTVSSVAGHKSRPGGAIYSATKYAVRAASEALRQEVKPYGIRTTILSPGAVDTELKHSVKAPGVSEAIADYYRDFSIPASSFARCLLFALSQPEEIDVNEILFRPTVQEL